MKQMGYPRITSRLGVLSGLAICHLAPEKRGWRCLIVPARFNQAGSKKLDFGWQGRMSNWKETLFLDASQGFVG